MPPSGNKAEGFPDVLFKVTAPPSDEPQEPATALHSPSLSRRFSSLFIGDVSAPKQPAPSEPVFAKASHSFVKFAGDVQDNERLSKPRDSADASRSAPPPSLCRMASSSDALRYGIMSLCKEHAARATSLLVCFLARMSESIPDKQEKAEARNLLRRAVKSVKAVRVRGHLPAHEKGYWYVRKPETRVSRRRRAACGAIRAGHPLARGWGRPLPSSKPTPCVAPWMHQMVHRIRSLHGCSHRSTNLAHQVESDGSVWQKVSDEEGKPQPPLELMRARPPKHGVIETFSYGRTSRANSAGGSTRTSGTRPKLVPWEARLWRRLTAADLDRSHRDVSDAKVLDVTESMFQSAHGWYKVSPLCGVASTDGRVLATADHWDGPGGAVLLSALGPRKSSRSMAASTALLHRCRKHRCSSPTIPCHCHPPRKRNT